MSNNKILFSTEFNNLPNFINYNSISSEVYEINTFYSIDDYDYSDKNYILYEDSTIYDFYNFILRYNLKQNLKNKHFIILKITNIEYLKTDIKNLLKKLIIKNISNTDATFKINNIKINLVMEYFKLLGYNIELLEQITSDIKIPIIICGGVGDYLDFEEGLKNPKIDAVAAANIFHYRDQSVYLAKKYLYDEGYNVRKPDLLDL